MNLTEQQLVAIKDKIASTKVIPVGMGTEEAACSVAMINLALTGTLSDRIPDCMSPIIGRWIIRVQDSMPEIMRNSDRWRELLPMAAGSGRNPAHEAQRLKLIMDWMWSPVLTLLQPIADEHGYGGKWLAMTTERTYAAADAAVNAAARYAALHATDARYAAVAADAAVNAAATARYAAAAADAAAAAAVNAAATARYAAAAAAADAADAAVNAAVNAAARYAAAADARYAAVAWEKINPCELLARLVEINQIDDRRAMK